MDRPLSPPPSLAGGQRSALLQATRLLDMASDAVMVRDLSGRITYWNRSAARRYGWAAEETIGQDYRTLLAPSFPVPAEVVEASLEATGQWGGRLAHARRDGCRIEAESQWELFRDELGRPNAVLQVDRPSAARLVETDRTDLMEDLFHHMPATFVFLDADWVYRLVTEQTAHLLGRTVEDMLGRHFLDVFPALGGFMEATHRAVCLEGRTVSQLGTRVVIPTPDGRELETHWDFTMRPVYDRQGGLRGLTSLGYEVSGRVALERADTLRKEALERANAELKEADRYKDEFLSVVSHELKTPLNFIMGFASILADEVNGALNTDQLQHVQRIQEGAVRMHDLVNDLLDTGQMAANRFRLALGEVSFDAVLDDVLRTLRPLAEKRSIRIEAEGRCSRPLQADRRRLLQVLTNLIGNALKFSSDGAVVAVRIHEGGDRLRVEVLDSGPGISAEDLCRLFAPFRQADMSPTRRVGGTGLGLYLAKVLIEAHQGQLGVDSDPGKGSSFWFELPLDQP